MAMVGLLSKTGGGKEAGGEPSLPEWSKMLMVFDVKTCQVDALSGVKACTIDRLRCEGAWPHTTSGQQCAGRVLRSPI
jgi:hypothetical protein